jgi:5-dehydro-2-deoxygluconokinase
VGLRWKVFNVLGAGDAFMAGFLRGWLRDEPLQACCDYRQRMRRHRRCRATAARRRLPLGRSCRHFLARRDLPFRLRDDAALEHLHWATTRAGASDELTVLAVDHRSQFEALCAQTGADPARIGDFKALALQALHRLAQGDDASAC